MELNAMKGFREDKLNQLKRAGLSSLEDIRYNYPRKYIDRTTCTGVLPETEESVVLFHCESVRLQNTKSMLIEAKGTIPGITLPVHILWFNQQFMYQEVKDTEGKVVMVAGIIKHMPEDLQYKKPERLEIYSPAVYSADGPNALRIYPCYKKIPGMAEDYYWKRIRPAAEAALPPAEEVLPEQIVQSRGLLNHAQMVQQLHEPTEAISLERAITRQRWDDLVYFALRIERNIRNIPNGSIYNLPSLAEMNSIRNTLPYQLTNAQDAALNAAISHIRGGKRLNALIQGDVGCGKTIVAQLLMVAFAGNGFQAAMMAPTKILAQQHYESLQKLCAPLGMEVAFISNTSQKGISELKRRIASGDIKLIVGTQSLLGKGIQFKNLALAIEDEEHKYGVLQKKALMEKCAGGTHTITMSATPIPLTLAQTIYADSVQLLTIAEKPAGRKPVLTGIAPNETKAIDFLKYSCGKLNAQAYVVCPVISESTKLEGVTSAEETYRIYKTALETDGIRVELLTGKTPKEEASRILDEFQNGSISVLVSTTIVEVGVNVPNANTMIIHNAERFGLAQLHQLRGRVGRGTSEAYCSLISRDTTNSRLQAMVQSNDGFMIAQMDLQQRGAGDFLGVQQSGTERYLALALQYPAEYAAAQQAAKDILDYGMDCTILRKAIQDHEEQKGGDI